jgi:putative FmdB family regulatory protein
MPIYEYKCQDCAKVFEEIVPIDSKKAFPCPACSSAKTVKILSVIGGIGKGATDTVSCGAGCPSAGMCQSAKACSQFS